MNILISTLLILFTLSACGGGTRVEPQIIEGKVVELPGAGNDLKGQISEVANEVQLLIGEASCATDNECRAVAMGHKACGGPAFYLAYSTTGTDTQKLEELAKQHQDLSKEYNQKEGLMSDCMFVSEPPLACVNNRCETR